MSDRADAIATIHAARAMRDTARDALYALELRRLALGRALDRERRGEREMDPADAAALGRLRGERAAAVARLGTLATKLDELAALEPRAAELKRRIGEAAKESSALVRRAVELAGALGEGRGAEARRRAQAALRAAQTRRADIELAVRRDRESLSALEARLERAGALRDEADALEARVAAIDAEIDAVTERARRTKLTDAAAENAEAIAGARARAKEHDARVRDAVATLYDGRPPSELIGRWDDAVPILLLPLRLETRWTEDAAGAPELRVRAYPDDVAVTTHEAVLTVAEQAHGRAYWQAFHAATIDSSDEQARQKAQAAAWHALATRFGANRAAWVAREMAPRNREEAEADPSLPLAFDEPQLTKPDAWTQAPHSRVLPDRLVLLAWRGDSLRVTQVGAPIDDIVVLGPAPLEGAEGESSLTRDPADGTLAMGGAFDWVRDFGRAVAAGLAFRVPLAPEDVAQGFDRMLVLGLKLSAEPDDARTLVEQLLDNHHYSRAGLAVLPQGTPTNNTDGGAAGYSRAEEPATAESGPPRFEPVDDRHAARDGQRIADFLGVAYAPLQYVEGADLADHAEAVAMNRALYAGTLGYYLDHMLNEVVDESALGRLRRHFTRHVTGRGPIAAIRVDAQPYGILPTSSLARWRVASTLDDRRPVVALLPGGAGVSDDAFEALLLHSLRRFDEAWSTALPNLARVGAAEDGAATLLEVLALHPTSAEFYQRIGYSWEYLQNLEAFAVGGQLMDDAIRMAMESMGARALLAQLGYVPSDPIDRQVKPHPLLLQLIWRHHQTRLDPRNLVDGAPLSEQATIAPYDAAGNRSYIDWLIEHAADGAALEAQNFGTGVARPGTLLYLMLHYSLVMEAGRGVHGWLQTRGVQAKELVRSRRFLNIGADRSPSLWEIFRAPANRLVEGEPSSRPVLELLHASQHAADAGQGVQEQRDALGVLRTLPTARLERALVEHVDMLSYRLDAWETSLFARRLHRQRGLDSPVAERRTGVHLGAYGYLEGLRPAARRRTRLREEALPVPLRRGTDDLFESPGNGGYVHAPSLGHATAAALLRSGYLTHATPAEPDALAVDLSSSRVRRARYLIDGIRNGQSLEVLLGVQFERGLHDWTTRAPNPVILDHLKPAFRAAYPITRTRVPQANDAANGAGTVSEDHSVVNGLVLARTTKPFPWDVPELAALDAGQQAAVQSEKAAIERTLDALRDVLTGEAAYQLALGNFDRAAAVVQSSGNGTIPPDIEVLATPRGTSLAFTQRVTVQLSAAAVPSPWANAPMTPRARLEPSLNAWLGALLGPPEEVRCTVAALAADGSVATVGAVRVEGTVSVEDLALQPIDLVSIVRSQVESTGAAELEARVRYRFARDRSVPDDVVVRIAFADAGGGAGARSFAEVLPLADRLRRLLGTARPLDARHFQSASKDAPPPADNPGRFDVAELRTRVRDRLAAVRGLVPVLAAAATTLRGAPTAANADALRSALRAIADAGVPYALPRSAFGAATPQVELLLAQSDSIVARATELGVATDDLLAQADAAAPAPRKLELLAQAAKAWMGADLVVLPRFAFHDQAAVAAADADRDALVAHARDTEGVPFPEEEWLHGAACVRPLVHDLEVVRLMADVRRDEPMAFAAIQLPYRAGDDWLGAPFRPGMEVLHDTVSIVQHRPQGFVAGDAQCGLLIDEWTESIPSRAEVTGLAFNYDAPNSAPPQALLLAVTPEETGRWAWDDLVDTVLDTFRRARLRAVEPAHVDGLSGIGTLLPAVIAEFGTSRASVSLDYAFTIDAVRGPALEMRTATPTNGG